LTLELQGLVNQDPGKLFRRTDETPCASSEMETSR